MDPKFFCLQPNKTETLFTYSIKKSNDRPKIGLTAE
jgi:hypothetical protein